MGGGTGLEFGAGYVELGGREAGREIEVTKQKWQGRNDREKSMV